MRNIKTYALRYITRQSIWVVLASVFSFIEVPLFSADQYLEQRYDWEKPPRRALTKEEFLQEAERITLKQSIFHTLQNSIAGQLVDLNWEGTVVGFEQARRAPFIPSMKLDVGGAFTYTQADKPGTLIKPSDATMSIAPSAAFTSGITLLNGTSLSFIAKVAGNHTQGPAPKNNTNTSSLAFSVTQPLLKGFMVNATSTGLKIAYLNFESAYWAKLTSIAGLVSNANQKYWAVVGAMKSLKITQDQTLRAAQTVETTKVLIANDLAIPESINDAIVALAKQRISLSQAEQRLFDTYHQFKLNMGDESLCVDPEQDLILDDYPIVDIDFLVYQAEMEGFIIESLDRRYDIQVALIAEEVADLAVLTAYNNFLPSLGVSGSVTNTDGANGSAARPFFSSIDMVNPQTNWTVGINFSTPLLDYAGRTAIIQAEIGRKRAKLARQQVVQSALSTLRTQVVDILAVARTLKQQKFAIEDTRDILSNKTVMLEQGLITINEYLGYQGSYTQLLLGLNNTYLQLVNLFVNLRAASATLIEEEVDGTIEIADLSTLPFGQLKLGEKNNDD